MRDNFHYWHYFLAIESDLEQSFNFVEPIENNYATYSIEFAKILLTASSEVDVVCKLLCKEIKIDEQTHSVKDYQRIILEKYPLFYKIIINIKRTEFTYPTLAILGC